MTQFACMLVLRIEDVQRECYSDSSASKELGMLRLIAKRALAQTFPNVEVVLRLYLCMMVCNCSGERTFSHLKLIKGALRFTIGQQRLHCLALMSTECGVLRKINITRCTCVRACVRARVRWLQRSNVDINRKLTPFD